MSALAQSRSASGKISCIPNNAEKYMTFSVRQLQFINTYQFLTFSLKWLVSDLKAENFKITSKGITDDELKFLCRKGVYQYNYVDSHDDVMNVSVKKNYHRRRLSIVS